MKDGRKNEPEVLRIRSEPATQDWNVQELLERVEGDRRLMRELLVMFRDENQRTMETVRVSMEERDLARASRAAHAMKGMLKNLAMGATAEIASSLEAAARNGLLSESEELFGKLEQALAQILPQVKAQLIEAQV